MTITNRLATSEAAHTNISIMDKGELISIDYAELEISHKGNSWFGCSVGFRAMQAAAKALNKKSIWSRENLYIISGHPGQGVKDAIDLITNCIQSDRFRLLDHIPAQGCSRDMKFIWWVDDGTTTVRIKLHDDFVPDTFYVLLDKFEAGKDKHDDRNALEQHKNNLSLRIWHHALENSFDVDVLSTPYKRQGLTQCMS